MLNYFCCRTASKLYYAFYAFSLDSSTTLSTVGLIRTDCLTGNHLLYGIGNNKFKSFLVLSTIIKNFVAEICSCRRQNVYLKQYMQFKLQLTYSNNFELLKYMQTCYPTHILRKHRPEAKQQNYHLRPRPIGSNSPLQVIEILFHVYYTKTLQ